MVLSELRIFHCLEDDVFLVDWLCNGLAEVEPFTTFDILNIDVIIVFFTFKSVELCSYDISIVVVKALELPAIISFLIFDVRLEDLLCLFKIVSNDISIVGIFVVLTEGLGQLVVSRIQQNVSTVFTVDCAVLFVDHDL